MIKVDMHMHTCASDGTWDVHELREELIRNKINIFSITDHDSIENVKRMEEIIKPGDNLTYIHGVELTTSYDGREYHLTVYGFEDGNQGLIDLMNRTNNNRINSNKEYIEKYAAAKYGILPGDYEKYEYDRKKGGWKSANFMIDRGIHRDLPSHLRDVDESGYRALLAGPEETIKIAKKSGAKIFLAHPSYNYRDRYMPENEMKYWLEIGIDGMECYSPYNSSFVQGYVDFCKKNNLMISGGSDCHGTFIGSRKLGVPHVELEDLNIKKILG